MFYTLIKHGFLTDQRARRFQSIFINFKRFFPLEAQVLDNATCKVRIFFNKRAQEIQKLHYRD